MHRPIRYPHTDNNPQRRTRRTSGRLSERPSRLSASLSVAELRREVIAILG